MWTPKRIVLLAAGFMMFFSGYAVYANFLGGIDGLPPLPECYLSKVDVSGPEPEGRRPPRKSALEDKLKQAFGPDCKELSRPIKLEMRVKRAVLTADTFAILPDGRIHLKPLSLALFGADHGDGRGIEINTLCAEQAYLKFDRPINNISEIGSRKIVAAELNDKIKVTNNHRTPNRDDDLHVDIEHGPLYYEEEKHLIWTKDKVFVRDDQSKPEPTEICGQMMDLELFAEPPPPKPGSTRKPKGESVTGVKSIVLHSDVEMNLYVDGQSGFPGGAHEQGPVQQPAKATGPARPAEKSHVIIKTLGRFRYDAFKDYDLARFDAPEIETGRQSQNVVATRSHEVLGKKPDTLVCKHLELRLRRKEATQKTAAAPTGGSAPERGLDIETAHATGPDGLVTLSSEVDSLEAKGNDFFYDAPKMLTILKGRPTMEAEKEHNVIRARELHIQEHKPAVAGGKVYQTATGIGPGTIDLIDKTNHVEGEPALKAPLRKVIRASWDDKFISTKDGPHDLLIFTRHAKFEDYEHDQTLGADTLKVWLQPKEASPAGPGAAPATGPQTPEKAARPDHLEALDNVTAHSPQMNIISAGRLALWFKDVPPDGKLPAVAAIGDAAGKAGVAFVAPASIPGPLATATGDTNVPVAITKPALADRAPGFVGPPKPVEPPRPIDLTARSVEAWVLRSDSRNTLDKLWTEGSVRVKQAPASPDEKGVDIEGDTLEMTCHPEGNFLVVTGDLAALRMDKIYIIGPEVNIDQATNKSWVTGAGAMEMESKTNFQGDALSKPVPLEVKWQKSMLFDGNYAEFHGGIQADQESAHLLCQRLEVHFDRPISLKEGAKGDQPPARVQELVCDRAVNIMEEMKVGEELKKYQVLVSPGVTMRALERDDDSPPQVPGDASNTGNEVRSSGPGTLRIWQAGGFDPVETPERPAIAPARVPAPNNPKAPAKPAEEMKMTYVSFESTMYANSKKNKADFFGNVRVLNFPSSNPKIDIDFDTMLEKMPPGGMYLRCDQMEVLNRAPKGSKSQQEMTAIGRVLVQSKEIYGRAAKVTFNEEKDQIIFDSGDDGYATLYKVEFPGQEPKKIEGKKIIHIRKTGDTKIEGGRSVSGG